jgi:predicted DNA-binding transcriptional regulator AlpA
MHTVLRKPDTCSRTGLPRSSFDALVAEGKFIRPFNIGVRTACWLESEVDTLIAAYASGMNDSKIRELVKLLECKRLELIGELL